MTSETFRKALQDLLCLRPVFTPRGLELLWAVALFYFAADLAQTVFWLFYSVGIWAWGMTILRILWLVLLAIFVRLFLELATTVISERKMGVPHAD